MPKLYTIGFTKKNAEKFFNTLIDHKVRKVIDTRINNESQLAGFAKNKDLKYFLKQIGNIEYSHEVMYAPTKELLEKYRKKEINWEEYTNQYLALIKNRKIIDNLLIEDIDGCCLLCSEDTPDKCHRRLLAEYLKIHFPSIEIIHIV
ncbi:MAG: DUF488 domain-containing protein [Ignavibacteriaceae bacterium]|nr:DUF488 domain-containing protein [Ignavibacteriaceae bacterium]